MLIKAMRQHDLAHLGICLGSLESCVQFCAERLQPRLVLGFPIFLIRHPLPFSFLCCLGPFQLLELFPQHSGRRRGHRRLGRLYRGGGGLRGCQGLPKAHRGAQGGSYGLFGPVYPLGPDLGLQGAFCGLYGALKLCNLACKAAFFALKVSMFVFF